MRPGLTGFFLSVAQKETDELTGSRHSFDSDRNRLCIDSTRRGNWLSIFSTFLDIDPDALKHARLGFVNRIAQAINSRQVVAIGVILSILFSMEIG